MKPLVQWLKVKRAAETEIKLVEKVNNRVSLYDVPYISYIG